MPLLPWLYSLVTAVVGFLGRYVGAAVFAAGSTVIGWLVANLPSIFKQLLLSLGIGFVTYQLGDFGLDSLYNAVEGRLSELPTIGIRFLKLSGVLDALSILFGALSARITYAMATNGRKTLTSL